MNESRFSVQVARIRKALRREFEEAAAPLEVTASQFHLLRRLWAGDGVTTSVLTQDACSDGGTVTGILDRLESKGVIRRERSAQDRRSVRIWLTPSGRALEAPLMKIVDDLNERALAGLNAQERGQLLQTMKKIGKNLDA